LIEPHSVPAGRVGLQDIELVGISQGTSEPFHNPQPAEQRRQSPLWVRLCCKTLF
jgi:hypothetical protein